MPLTDEQLAAIEERANKATTGPWNAHPPTYNKSRLKSYRNAITSAAGVVAIAFTRGFRYHCNEMPNEPCADAQFIAHARTDVPALLSDLRAARQALREVADLLTLKEHAIPGRDVRAVNVIRRYFDGTIAERQAATEEEEKAE